MITTVTGKNQVTVPAGIAAKAGIRAGARLDWELTDDAGVLRVQVLPDPARIATSLEGRGKRFLTGGESPVDDLIRSRENEDLERQERG
jgi:AbrB family looped-hinge helix DNA binding protein